MNDTIVGWFTVESEDAPVSEIIQKLDLGKMNTSVRFMNALDVSFNLLDRPESSELLSEKLDPESETKSDRVHFAVVTVSVESLLSRRSDYPWPFGFLSHFLDVFQSEPLIFDQEKLKSAGILYNTIRDYLERNAAQDPITREYAGPRVILLITCSSHLICPITLFEARQALAFKGRVTETYIHYAMWSMVRPQDVIYRILERFQINKI